MKKCALWTAAIVAGVVLLASFTSVGSYLCLGWNKLHTAVKHAVPPEVEIERLQMELAKVDDDMSKSFDPIAKEMTEVKNLKDEIAGGKERLAQEKKNILSMKADLEAGARKVSYRGATYSGNHAAEKLSSVFETYKVAEQSLTNKEKLLAAKEKNLQAAKDRLAAMRATRDQLKVEVERMKSELEAVRLAQTESKVQVDDSRLAGIKASLKDLHNRIDTEKNKLTVEQEFVGGNLHSTPEKVNDRQVLKDIDEHFGATGTEKVVEKP